MTDEELSISDATLIARLRAANAYKGPDFNTPIADPIKVAAADRIEQLVATNKRLETMLHQMIDDPEYWTPYARATLKGADHE